MSVFFVTHQLEEEYKYVIEGCNKLIEPHCAIHLNLPQHNPEKQIQNNDFVVSFGKLAAIYIDSITELNQQHNIVIQHIRLPDAKNLISKKENAKNRNITLEKLTQLKEQLNNNIPNIEQLTITNQNLPDLTATQLLLLKQITDENKYILQTTQSGQVIKITHNITEEQDADIQLTFAEIYTIRAVMDVLGIQQVEKIYQAEDKKK